MRKAIDREIRAKELEIAKLKFKLSVINIKQRVLSGEIGEDQSKEEIEELKRKFREGQGLT